MADSARDRMVDSAIKLLAVHGLQGASFSTILDDSNAPRGSIYYHFPGGKDELVLAAIERAGDRAIALVENLRGSSPEEIVRAFVEMWRSILRATDFRVGCSLAGVTVSADDRNLIDEAALVFRTWQSHMTEVLVEGGVDPARGDDISTLALAACEGAVILCRAQRSLAPLDSIEGLLVEVTNAAMTKA